MVTRILSRAVRELLLGGLVARLIVVSYATAMAASELPSIGLLKFSCFMLGLLFFLGAGGTNHLEESILEGMPDVKQAGPRNNDSRPAVKKRWDAGCTSKTSG